MTPLVAKSSAKSINLLYCTSISKNLLTVSHVERQDPPLKNIYFLLDSVHVQYTVFFLRSIPFCPFFEPFLLLKIPFFCNTTENGYNLKLLTDNEDIINEVSLTNIGFATFAAKI